MSHQPKNRRMTALCTALAGACSLAPFVWAESPQDVESLRNRVAELETKLASIQSAAEKNWLSSARQAEVRAMVQDVLADADSRANLLAAGGAGWANGPFLASDDGNFRLELHAQMQFRYVFNMQDDRSGDSSRGGFENRRTKLILNGHIVDPSWLYRVEGNFGSEGGTFGLQDAYIAKAFDNGWVFVAGQLKVPMLREFLVDSTQQLAVERSLVDAEFNAGRTQGVALDFRNEQFHFTVGFTDGHSATGGFNRPALARDTEYSFTARAEVLLAGGWDQFNDLTSWPDEEFGFLLGGALHYQDGEYGTADDEIEAFQWTVDASLEFGGANLFAFIVGRHLEATGVGVDQYGAVIQGGFFLTDEWELYGRYEWGDDDTAADDLSIFTIGANRYFAKNSIKWSTDVGFAFNEVSSTWGDGFLGTGGNGAGWRSDATDDDGQIVIRTQLQLQF